MSAINNSIQDESDWPYRLLKIHCFMELYRSIKDTGKKFKTIEEYEEYAKDFIHKYFEDIAYFLQVKYDKEWEKYTVKD